MIFSCVGIKRSTAVYQKWALCLYSHRHILGYYETLSSEGGTEAQRSPMGSWPHMGYVVDLGFSPTVEQS